MGYRKPFLLLPSSSSSLLLPPLVTGYSLLSSTEADPQGMRHLSRKLLAPAKKEKKLVRQGSGKRRGKQFPGDGYLQRRLQERGARREH